MSTLAPHKVPFPASADYGSSARRVGLVGRPASRPSWRRSVNVLINITLLGLVLVTFATGWVAAIFGWSEFGLHKYSSIALLLVASGHVVLHWRSLSFQLRNLAGKRIDRRSPARSDRRVGSPEPGTFAALRLQASGDRRIGPRRG
jgi:hypothetical protein